MFRSPRFLVPLTLVLLIGAGLAAKQACLIGNLEDPIGPPVPGVVQGDQVFAYLVHPIEQCACSENWVQLQNLRMWLAFESWMVPQNFWVRAGIQRAEWDPTQDQWVPAGYFYESVQFPVEVFEPGPFVLDVPAINARWMNIHEYYFLTLTFLTPLDAFLLADGLDAPGISYVSPDGDNWFDLYIPDKTSGGKPIIWGDVLCGTNDGSAAPVPEAGSRLLQPVPNPFNPSTRISLVLEESSPVLLTIHDAKGRRIRTLADEQRDAGTWNYEWDGRNAQGLSAPAGLYFFRAQTRSGVQTQKAALVK